MKKRTLTAIPPRRQFGQVLAEMLPIGHRVMIVVDRKHHEVPGDAEVGEDFLLWQSKYPDRVLVVPFRQIEQIIIEPTSNRSSR